MCLCVMVLACMPVAALSLGAEGREYTAPSRLASIITHSEQC